MSVDHKLEWREVYARHDGQRDSTHRNRLNRKVIEAAKRQKRTDARNALIAEFVSNMENKRLHWMLDDEPHRAQLMFNDFLRDRGIKPFSLDFEDEEDDS